MPVPKMLLWTTSFRSDTGAVHDVHLMMKTAYAFWLHEGAWGATVDVAVDVLKCVVMAVTVFVLSFMVDWTAALSCVTEQQCFETTIVHGVSTETVPGAHLWLAVILCVSAVAATLYEMKRLVETSYLQSAMHELVSSRIECGPRSPFHLLASFWSQWRAEAHGYQAPGAADSSLPQKGDDDDRQDITDLTWSAFLHIFCEIVQLEKSLRIHQSRGNPFDELRAVQALMIYDNYFIALHQHVLNPERFRGFGGSAIAFVDPPILKFLIQSLFDDFNMLIVTHDQRELMRQKLFWYLASFWGLYPFLVSHAIVKFLVKNVAAFRSKPMEFVERQWTPKAWWTFRLFNEVPHLTEERLMEAQSVGRQLITRSSRPWPLAKFAERLTAAIIVVILAFSFINPAVLLGGVVAGRSLVWWLSTAVLVYGIVHQSEVTPREYRHQDDVSRLVHLLHFERPEWRVSGARCVAALNWDYFHSRIYFLGSTVVRTLFMPLILLKLYFDGSITELIEFIQTHSERVNGLSSIASGAAFVSDSRMIQETPRSPEVQRTAAGMAIVEAERRKWEKSVASFAAVYPQWRMRAMDVEDPFGLRDFLCCVFDGHEPAQRAPSQDSQVPQHDASVWISSRSAAHVVEHAVVSRVDDMHYDAMRRSSVASNAMLFQSVVSAVRREDVPSGGFAVDMFASSRLQASGALQPILVPPDAHGCREFGYGSGSAAPTATSGRVPRLEIRRREPNDQHDAMDEELSIMSSVDPSPSQQMEPQCLSSNS